MTVALLVICNGYINFEKFSIHRAKLFVIYILGMPSSVYKVLVYRKEVIENALFPIGQL